MNFHAMKNDEWAAVAYLSQSAYGKLGNVNFTDADKEVYINRCQNKTGCSIGSFYGSYGCPYTYDDNMRYADGTSGKGVGASTTGTIYGIYDMNGGYWEYVMGNYNDTVGSSGFSSPLTLDSKYYNKYASSNILTACNGGECLSHALSKTSGWYGDNMSMIMETRPWSIRGGYYGATNSNGVFSLDYASNHAGEAHHDISFCLVLSPNL